jgi:hypothetical protein
MMGGVVGSDTEAEEQLSREEILDRHEPIHTYPRPRRDPVGGVWQVILWSWALVCGVIAGLVLPWFWAGFAGALFGWMLDPLGMTAVYVIFLIPPVVLIGWMMLRQHEENLRPATKVFLGSFIVTWLYFVFAEVWLV